MPIDSLSMRIREKLNEIQNEFESEMEEQRRKFEYRLEQGRVVFEKGVIPRHRLLRIKLLRFIRTSSIGVIITAPVIYSLIIPVVLSDLLVTIYQHICFPVYRIPLVKRSEYVVMDRKYLEYLNLIQKVNCIYCEYANGVIAYVREVASRTEYYWCPIKHARKAKGTHDRYYDFLDYGDSEDFMEKWEHQREKCRACEAPCGDSQKTNR